MFEEIVERLKKNNLTYKWLMCMMESVGFKVDKISMSRWAHGAQTNGRAAEGVQVATKILDEYEKFAKGLKL